MVSDEPAAVAVGAGEQVLLEPGSGAAENDKLCQAGCSAENGSVSFLSSWIVCFETAARLGMLFGWPPWLATITVMHFNSSGCSLG
jgi:hypothetical protein